MYIDVIDGWGGQRVPSLFSRLKKDRLLKKTERGAGFIPSFQKDRLQIAEPPAALIETLTILTILSHKISIRTKPASTGWRKISSTGKEIAGFLFYFFVPYK
jgi:hypothetical protein